jgi:hypothetical protein
MSLKINVQQGVIVILVVIILLYWFKIYWNPKLNDSKNIKITEGFEDPPSGTNESSSLLSWYQNALSLSEPAIYQNLYDYNKKLAPMLKFNLKIDPLRKEVDKDTGKIYERLLVPIHITTLLDGRILAVFNDGKLYMKPNLFSEQLWVGPLVNSLYGSQTDGVGMRMIMNFPLNHNQERQIKLLGVGQDSTLYYKETEDIQSPWIRSPLRNTNNNDLVYIFCDYYQSAEDYYPLLYGITTSGDIVYKNNNNKPPISTIEDVDFFKLPFTQPIPAISDNIKVIKVFWDKNGFMIGIGQDLRLYQKKGIDWRVRPWEVSESTRGTNPGSNTQLIDIMMDNDGRMIGIVLDSESNPPNIKIQKQNQSYYLADFLDISEVTAQNRIYNDQEMLKFKTGLDWTVYLSFEDPDEVLYRTNNLNAIYQRSVMLDKFKLRKLCQERKPSMNLDARNFDLERVINQKENKIRQLNSELSGLLKYNVSVDDQSNTSFGSSVQALSS